MSRDTTVVTGLLAAFALAGGVLVRAGQQGTGQQGVGQTPSQFPLSNPIRARGSSVTGAYDGWYRDRDGTVRLLVGYYNRNTQQELDIPIGPDNRIEPGAPDQGQPTHFQTGHQWGVFTIAVPKDFGNKKLTWTLVANGQTNVITMHTRPEWVVEPFKDAASGNTPPVLKFEQGGRTFTGPPAAIAAQYATTASTPLTLTTWVTDEGPTTNVEPPPPDPADPAGPGRGRGGRGRAARGINPPLSIGWSVFRGAGGVMLDSPRPSIDRAAGGKATATATFSAPGEYILRAQANDGSGDGGGGFQCCWTNAHVRVTVKPDPKSP
jgi:hypothetical protein